MVGGSPAGHGPRIQPARKTHAERRQGRRSRARLAEAPGHQVRAGRDGAVRAPSDNAFGVSVSNIQQLAKRLGKSHELAAGLWKTGWHEARMLAAYVDEPERVTPLPDGPLVP